MREALPLAPGCGRCVKVGRLFRDPAKEAHDLGMLDQLVAIAPAPREFGIGKDRLDRAAADRVHRHGGPPSPAFRHGMIAIDLLSERAKAQPTGRRGGCGGGVFFKIKVLSAFF